MNMEALYTSGHWSGVLSRWVESYEEMDKQVIEDYKTLAGRIKNIKIAAALASTMQQLLKK